MCSEPCRSLCTAFKDRLIIRGGRRVARQNRILGPNYAKTSAACTESVKSDPIDSVRAAGCGAESLSGLHVGGHDLSFQARLAQGAHDAVLVVGAEGFDRHAQLDRFVAVGVDELVMLEANDVAVFLGDD